MPSTKLVLGLSGEMGGRTGNSLWKPKGGIGGVPVRSETECLYKF